MIIYKFDGYNNLKTRFFYCQVGNEPKVSSEWTNLMKAGMTELKGGQQCCANHGLSLLIKATKQNGEVR